MNKNQIVSRLLQMVIVLIGISFLTFLLTYLSPGDPARNIFTHSGVMPSQEMIEDMRRTLGLDKPFFTQYKDWLFNCLQGNFGDSFMLQKPVAELLMERLWPTLKLTLASTVLMLLFSVPLGVISAVNHNKPVDYFVRAITFFGVSIPNFWLGLMLILIFCVKLGLLPVVSSGGDFKSLILPAVTLAVAMTAKYTRQVRTAVLEELHSDYVIGARARGVSESRILWGNVLPNSLLPLITMLGLSIGSLLGGTSVVEIIYSYPGLGNLAVSAIMSADYFLLQGYVLWVSVIYMLINLIVDISYNYVDPRMRLRR
ncbi:MAG: ABC transporter permease [Acidaminococcaceae bacterium]|nr:ABC transporter permease [Acidaminococcaceae bacterium]